MLQNLTKAPLFKKCVTTGSASKEVIPNNHSLTIPRRNRLAILKSRALKLDAEEVLKKGIELQRVNDEIKNAREEDPQSPRNIKSSLLDFTNTLEEDFLLDQYSLKNENEISLLERSWASLSDTETLNFKNRMLSATDITIKGKRRNRKSKPVVNLSEMVCEDGDNLDMSRLEHALFFSKQKDEENNNKKGSRKIVSALSTYHKSIMNVPTLSFEQEKYMGRYIQNGNKILNIFDVLEKRNGVKPSLHQVAEVLSTDSHKIQKYLNQRDRARKLLYRYNMRFAYTVAKGYKGMGVEFEDLFSAAVGPKGLEKAVDKFDPEKGFRFATYAVYWIKMALSQCILSEMRVIKLPSHVSASVTKILKIRNSLYTQTGQYPTTEELSKATGIPPHKIDLYMTVSILPRSMEETIDAATHRMDQSGNSFGELLSNGENPVEEHLKKASLAESVNLALSTLNQRERKILEIRYGLRGGEGKVEAKTLNELSDICGLSLSTVRKIESTAMEKLRKPWRMNMLDQDLLKSK